MRCAHCQAPAQERPVIVIWPKGDDVRAPEDAFRGPVNIALCHVHKSNFDLRATVEQNAPHIDARRLKRGLPPVDYTTAALEWESVLQQGRA